MRYHHSYHAEGDLSTDDPDWWAVEFWMNEWWADENQLREGILELVAAAETEVNFAVLGAAIMEDFVADDDDRLRWLEQQASASEAFRRSLANVRVWGMCRDEVAARVEDAARVPLPRRGAEEVGVENSGLIILGRSTRVTARCCEATSLRRFQHPVRRSSMESLARTSLQ
jgi:hypothetical protein